MRQYSNRDELTSAKILVPNGNDGTLETRNRVLERRHSTHVLNLTIAPTLACNFGCAYCFQRLLPKYTMTSQTEDGLLRFIKDQGRKAKLLQITWFGGEPLLALGRIKSICKRIRKETGLPIQSGVVTNGYLLDGPTATLLRDLGVSFYQVTLDGQENTHDSRRPLHDGRGTFTTIVRNVAQLLELDRTATVAIRVNIDKENSEEYHSLYTYLLREFDSKRVRIYPGFVDNYTFGCTSVESCTLDRNARARFCLDQYYKYGIYSDWFYPRVSYENCMARAVNGFVVGPRGDLYKCLAVIGVEQLRIGNVNNHGNYISNEELMAQFLEGDDYLNSARCQRCVLFPVCDGGCPYLKLKERILGEPHETCIIAKGHLEDFLDAHIDSKERRNGEA